MVAGRAGDKPIKGKAVPIEGGSKLSRVCCKCGARPGQRCFKTGKNNYGETMSHQHPDR
jgi:hypothetical protein